MCGLQSMDNALKDVSKELTASDISTAFKDKTLDSLDLIRFTGGEPFLKNDFPQIIEQIWKNAAPKLFYITTNGTYTDRIKDFVKYYDGKDIKLNIQISLDSANEMHDKIRGVPGLFNKALATLEMLKTFKDKSKNIIIGVNQTIIKENMDEIAGVNKLMKQLGFEHKIYVAVDSHESTIMSKGKKTYEFKLCSDYTREEIEKIYDEIQGTLWKNKKFRGITDVNYIWHLVEEFLVQGSKNRALKIGNTSNAPCLAAFLYFRLMPNGDVMPCTLKPMVLGNLRNETFSSIWYSKETQLVRKNEIKTCPGCWVECDIVSNFVYSPFIIKRFLSNLISKKK
ncbi:MAG: hypothetical protein A3J83_06475 [Elusimicrobia bacterium RIFOXYA2_FULL_40_6]|nr:MAG: hypothetical protein A3J83_06475 [Elusimicrobia bacterium RIFOXYA2_FULL_40_6]